MTAPPCDVLMTPRTKLVDFEGHVQVSGIAAFVLAIATSFKPNWARWSAPLYAAVKGFFLGAVSLFFELQYPGIAMSAVLLTFGTAGGLLALFKGNFIRVTDRFRNIVTTSLVRCQLRWRAVTHGMQVDRSH